jgi:hypothetical protein
MDSPYKSPANIPEAEVDSVPARTTRLRWLAGTAACAVWSLVAVAVGFGLGKLLQPHHKQALWMILVAPAVILTVSGFVVERRRLVTAAQVRAGVLLATVVITITLSFWAFYAHPSEPPLPANSEFLIVATAFFWGVIFAVASYTPWLLGAVISVKTRSKSSTSSRS